MPSPALLAQRAPRRAQADAAPPAAAANDGRHAETGVVYSSSTDTGPTIAPDFRTTEELAESIDQIVSRILDTWLDGRTAEQRAELVASRPSIPRDVDRALLLDLSAALGVYDLSDTIRYQLRAQFWVKVDQTEHT